MNIQLHTQDLQTVSADVLIVPVFAGETAESEGLKVLDATISGAVTDAISGGELKGKPGEIVILHQAGQGAWRRLMLIGMGDLKDFSLRRLRQRIGQAARVAAGKGATSLAVAVRGNLAPHTAAVSVVEGVLLGLYDPAIYRKKETDRKVTSLTVCVSADVAEVAQQGLEEGRILAEAANFSRSLSVEPGNKLPPREMAQRAQHMCETYGLEYTVFGPEKMHELGMGALLGVAVGSDEPPQLIIMHYVPQERTSDSRLALVGKGITFDTGGICIKSRDTMWEMKYDMSGGAAVIGAMQAIAQLQPGVEVYGLVAAAENMPSGKSYRPGDVLHSYDGMTIEVIDTDAEGRLVLSDAIAYARTLGATHIVDLATLTGAVLVALGVERAGLMGSDPGLVEAVKHASELAGEKLWELPLDEEYREQIKSDIADIKNLGGRFAGTITAGYFLREFAHDTPWVHLDIAGTAWLEDEAPDMAKGPTGFGVTTITYLAKTMAG